MPRCSAASTSCAGAGRRSALPPSRYDWATSVLPPARSRTRRLLLRSLRLDRRNTLDARDQREPDDELAALSRSCAARLNRALVQQHEIAGQCEADADPEL